MVQLAKSSFSPHRLHPPSLVSALCVPAGAPPALQGARLRGDDGGHTGAAVSDDRPDVPLGPDQRPLEAPGLPRPQGRVGRTATQHRPGPAR